MPEPQNFHSAREILRALAEARDGPFYHLWVKLCGRWWHDLLEPIRSGTAHPTIEFRIYQVADSSDALAVVSVNGKRPGGPWYIWSLTVRTERDQLEVSGSVWSGSEGNEQEVFSVTECAANATDAAHCILRIAGKVCERREGIG